MGVISYGSMFLDPEVAILFFAAAFLGWIFRQFHFALACGAAGLWLAATPWLEPLFAEAFAHLPIWVPVLILLWIGWSFVRAVAMAFGGPAAGRALNRWAISGIGALFRWPFRCLSTLGTWTLALILNRFHR